MNLFARAKAILMTPRQEWVVIDAEPVNVGALLMGYVLPLAAIGPIASFIGFSLFGFGGLFRLSIGTGISLAITSFIMAIVGVFVLAWIINALAPSFGATQSMSQAIKLAAYSSTAAWVAGIFGLIPPLAIIAALGGLYSLYLCYLGLPVLMKSPADKTMTYFIVIIVAAIIIYFVIRMITSRMMYF
jgi:hypothetical protein